MSTRTPMQPLGESPAERRALWQLKVGAALAVLGIVLSLLPHPVGGGWLAVGGLALCVVGLHRYGRAGAK